MKAVMISTRPEWCEKIASGEKTEEIRKNRPELEPPFKVYIYQTKHREHNGPTYSDGKVIGEFVCNRFTFLDAYYDTNGNRHLCNTAFIKSCVPDDELFDYLYGKHGEKHGGWAWHISGLVIYDKPKRLSEFYREGDCDCMNCRKCAWFDAGNGYNVEADCNLAYKGIRDKKTYKPIIKPPQSWFYVEGGE